MSHRPIKIKRNTSISGKKRQRNAVIKKVASIVVAFAALGALGFVGAPAVMELADNMSKPKPPVITPAPVVTPAPQGTPEATNDPSDGAAQPVKALVFRAVAASELTDEAAIKATAQKLREQGVTNAVVTFKDAEGRIHYETNTEIGKQAMSPAKLDVAKIAELFKAEGVSVTGEVYAFRDKITPAIDRETSVKYVGTEYNWLDSSQDLGGKPWANPASSVMQNYLYDIVKELSDKGVRDFVLSGVQLPTGYSLDKRDFGVTNDQLQAQLQGFINTMASKVGAKGGNAWFSFDLEPLNAGDVARYIISPQRYGVSHVILKGNADQFAEGVSDATVAKFAGEESVESLVLWNTDASLAESENTEGYFIK